jgi:hypothetical protein
MNQLGNKYSVQHKGYYNDKHEDESNVLYWKDFIEQFKQYEPHIGSYRSLKLNKIV